VSASPAKGPVLSVVVPVYNEEAGLPELFRRLTAALESFGVSWEVICVNDGSRDRSAVMLTERCREDQRYRCIHFSRNFGHQAAVTAGIDHASGQAVAVIDADLQDPPELIGAMLEKWREGFEVVYGIRRKRKESLFKRTAYFLFYRMLKSVTKVDIPLDAGDFALIDRRVAEMLRAMPERNRFVRGIRSWIGFRQTGLEYERDARFAGEVKYTFSKLVRLALDGIISFSYAPLRLAVYMGLLVSGTSFLLGVWFLVMKLTVGIDLRGWASTMVAILFMGGVQLLTLGAIGEYVSRIYDEVKQRPLYIAAELTGFEVP
jgi:dolichol-phosphate mannosyltransferase